MTHSAICTLAIALGLRHGVDPDHLAAIDGLTRLRPSRWNGILFALGHGAIVALLAIGVGGMLARIVGPYTPWLLILLGAVNLWRLRAPATHCHRGMSRMFSSSPLLLGVLFGAGFETASQLSALVLAADINPWVLGGLFALGMLLVDGIDGYVASRTQSQAGIRGLGVQSASPALGIFVVIVSFGLGAAELLRLDVDRVALPLGCALFACLIAVRFWSLRDLRSARNAGPLFPTSP
jgi:high-affinity nickel-transport protein